MALDTCPSLNNPEVAPPISTDATQTAWWEIEAILDADQEDLAYLRLQSCGGRGTAVEVHGDRRKLKAYLPLTQTSSVELEALALALTQDAVEVGLAAPEIRWSQLESEDWAHAWKEHWHPQEIGDRLFICPRWIEPTNFGDRIVLRMDPGVAFGTGMHPTTQLCLEALEMRLDDLPLDARPTVADVGCGSGTLSIAAAQLGAKQVFATDIDPLAVAATRQNSLLNGIDDGIIDVRHGSLSDIPVRVDGLVCNILAEVIAELIPQLRLVVRDDGWMVFSGVLMEQAEALSEQLESYGWMVAALWKRREWCCLNVRSS